MSDETFCLKDSEITKAVEMYGELGEKTADEYKHLPLTLKRTAAVVVIGVIRHMTPDQVRQWSDDDDFRANADALIMAYELQHPEKLGPEIAAGEFIYELSSRLDHSKCDHAREDRNAHEAFHDTSERLNIPDTDVDAKFADILAGFDATAETDGPRPASFEVGTDGETTDQRKGDA
jgi:hypothetical protein